MPSDKPPLRRQARRYRRAIAADERAMAEAAVSGHLISTVRRLNWRRIAAYVATASELDLSRFLAAATVTIHLPTIDVDGAMRFRHWLAGTPLVEGPHRIAQPPTGNAAIAPEALDAVLLPLLAFDDRGTRLGSGAGYYDRALAFRRRQAAPPLLVGIAFEAQRVDALPREPWDIPLDAIVTERGWHDFAPPG